MAKTKTLSTAAKPDDIQIAYMKAVQALKKAGFNFPTKKPDDAKIGIAMGKKKAEFQLVKEDRFIRLAVEAGSLKSVLGLYDTTSEKDDAKQLVKLQGLKELGLDCAAEIKKLTDSITAKQADAANNAKAAGKGGAANKGPDPAVAKKLIKDAEALKKTIDSYKAERATITKLKFADVAKNATRMKSFEAYCKETHVEENIEFIRDAGKKDVAFLKATYIGDKAPKQINIDSGAVAKIEAGAHPKTAVPIIVGLLDMDVLPKWRAKLTGALDNLIKAEQTKIDAIEKTLHG